MPYGSPEMEMQNHNSYLHDRYKSYEVFSFGENIKEEILDTVSP